ncbi:alpha/beta hydrolase [Aquimarina hainanensis]|uniref:Alpha/beta hydrolase n=1 Tax=Aquimarina hainanensis TaxID=1578017 RepID=A0ABW5NB34_9FLAO|nr:YqiA/YcfP family alpha/beta fold hydrolase [Aquimarina sp. TRL1]QKX03425.1 alpha/beta hydrolase [Aquimarina sp. TRL1]
MNIYFSHGKESGPKGYKIKRLSAIAKDMGCGIYSIDYTAISCPEKRADLLIKYIQLQEKGTPYILVGSSMGGYVSLAASETISPKAIFLMAPALYINGYQKQHFIPKTKHIEIVHGWKDTVISPNHSLRFAQSLHCDLHLINGDHRLTDAITSIEALFSNFLKKHCINPNDK